MKLMSFAFILLIWSHIIACFFYIIPQLEGMGPDTWVVMFGYQDKGSFDVITENIITDLCG